jgi:hypothetical protein
MGFLSSGIQVKSIKQPKGGHLARPRIFLGSASGCFNVVRARRKTKR